MKGKTEIKIDDNLYLSQVQDSDAARINRLIGRKSVSDTLLHVPFPYMLSDAFQFIELVERSKTKHDELIYFSIRDKNGEVIGGVNRKLEYGKDSSTDEIAYWLGEPFWKKV